MTRAYATLRRKPVKAIQNRMARAYDQVVYGQASELDVCDELTDVALADDLDWVRGVIARELLRQLRLPEDKRAAKDRRMARAVRLREQGLTIRQIAEQLGASVGIVQSDLTRWGQVRSKVTEVAFKNSVQNTPGSASFAQEPTTDLNAEIEQPIAAVTPIRRSS